MKAGKGRTADAERGAHFGADQRRLAEGASRRASAIVGDYEGRAAVGAVAWPDLDRWEDVGVDEVVDALLRTRRRRPTGRDGQPRRRAAEDFATVTLLFVEATLRRRAADLAERSGFARRQAEARACVALAGSVTPEEVAEATLDARRAAMERRRKRFARTEPGRDMAAMMPAFA